MVQPRLLQAVLLLFLNPLVWGQTRSVRRGNGSTVNQHQHQQQARKAQATTGASRFNRVANDGNPATSYPLKKCQGDCDRDSDCASGLACFQRNMGDRRTIPGCKGTPLSDSTDYCFDPAVAQLSAPVVVKSPTPGVLVPTTAQPPTPVASTLQQPVRQELPTRIAPVFKPPIPPVKGQLKDVGIDWSPQGVYPLGLCQGDCDGDSDCAGELVCHQRKDTVVPSCTGKATHQTDYCIHPEDETARPPVPGAFRLKLDWQPGYEWQEEAWEQEWCMECDGNTCEDGDALFLRTCKDDNTWFIYQPPLNQTSTGIIQFQLARTNLCLEWVDARDVRVRTCNSTFARQKFKALNGKFGSRQRFEISTARREGCLSQHHHPKDGEKIFRANCTRFRTFDTSYWTQYE